MKFLMCKLGRSEQFMSLSMGRADLVSGRKAISSVLSKLDSEHFQIPQQFIILTAASSAVKADVLF